MRNFRVPGLTASAKPAPDSPRSASRFADHVDVQREVRAELEVDVGAHEIHHQPPPMMLLLPSRTYCGALVAVVYFAGKNRVAS